MVLSLCLLVFGCFFFFKQKTAYEMRISDWSSDVCSSDLLKPGQAHIELRRIGFERAAPTWVLLDDLAERGFGIHWVSKELGYAGGKIGRASCRERECQYV